MLAPLVTSTGEKGASVRLNGADGTPDAVTMTDAGAATSIGRGRKCVADAGDDGGLGKCGAQAEEDEETLIH